ncbi:MAG: bifunctional heptose 7-phosphate kinase/heptose 1-phosphate adenyltransferase [Clostridiales bacterium]|jgi:D-beta-D-heptose 7-phosphate kinase/D-beta-D-heptose 1-phosphate adenosyltransferase|nr:bifunctional heptose 7-phosphate kinase/heptose 1-phosphate adenyltransferase [Clostridiales bacterium]
MLEINNLNQVRILVAGDFFLDHYYYGKVKRVSPEAPVPVLNVTCENNIPGGAANVVNNLCALGCNAVAFGIVGLDSNGRMLAEKLNKAGADIEHLQLTNKYQTIVKSRVIGDRNHQFVRLDFNENGDFPNISDLLDKLPGVLKNCDAAVLSDYGKGYTLHGTAEIFVEACRSQGIPIIVDPKGTDWSKYRGASWITPNFTEFAAAAALNVSDTDDGIAQNISKIAERFDIENVLVTRSERGMTLYHQGVVTHYRAKAREVADVSGAGDTVAAVLAAMLGSGAAAEAAVDISNIAAGIVVGKRGTAAVTRMELFSGLRALRLDRVSAKIMDWETLFTVVKQWKENGKTIAVANGCFDIFHRGHASLVQTAAGFCDKLIVAINSDAMVRKLKGAGRPVNNEDDRAYVLASLEYVDAVVIFPQETPEELLSRVLPDVLVKGGEYTLEQVPGRQYAKRVELVEYINGYSTTAIVNRSKGSE